jgi:hypothetical protein
MAAILENGSHLGKWWPSWKMADGEKPTSKLRKKNERLAMTSFLISLFAKVKRAGDKAQVIE